MKKYKSCQGSKGISRQDSRAKVNAKRSDGHTALLSPESMGKIVSCYREFSAISWDKIGVHSLLRRRRGTEKHPAFSWALSRATVKE